MESHRILKHRGPAVVDAKRLQKLVWITDTQMLQLTLSEKQLAARAEKLRLLMRLRGTVVHGAAPNVHESTHYQQYYSTYLSDPHAEIMAEMRAQGRLGPPRFDPSILPNTDRPKEEMGLLSRISPYG